MALATGIGIIGLAASVGVGLTFLTAGWVKFRHRHLFVGVVGNYRILPQPMVAPVARLLPLIELTVGLALVCGAAMVERFSRAFALSGIALLVAFAFAMAVNIRRGRSSIDCGCGSSQLRQSIGVPLVLRNLGLAMLLALRIGATPALAGTEILVAYLGGLAVFLVYLLFNAVDALSRSSAAVYRRTT